VREYLPVRVDGVTRSLSIALVVLMICVGIFPDRFMQLTEAAAAALLM